MYGSGAARSPSLRWSSWWRSRAKKLWTGVPRAFAARSWKSTVRHVAQARNAEALSFPEIFPASWAWHSIVQSQLARRRNYHRPRKKERERNREKLASSSRLVPISRCCSPAKWQSVKSAVVYIHREVSVFPAPSCVLRTNSRWRLVASEKEQGKRVSLAWYGNSSSPATAGDWHESSQSCAIGSDTILQGWFAWRAKRRTQRWRNVLPVAGDARAVTARIP